VPAQESPQFPSALLSYPDARHYLGDLSASKFFADLLPELDVVRFGRRSFVTRDSLDRLIERHRVKSAAEQPIKQPRTQSGDPEGHATKSDQRLARQLLLETSNDATAPQLMAGSGS
jgi:hypothetical protein